MKIHLEIIKTVFLSACVGAVSGAVVALIGTYLGGGNVIQSALHGAVSGSLIGLCASSSFIVLMQNAGKYPVASIIAVLVVCAIGTAAALLFFGVPSTGLFIIIIILSEIFSIVITLVWYSYYRRLNKQLHETQQRLKNI